jgi:hypothetical protein
VVPNRLALPAGWGRLDGDKEVKTPLSKSQVGLQKCGRKAQTETQRVPKLLGSKFIKQASSNSTPQFQRLSPGNKEDTPYVPFRTAYRNERWVQLVSYIITCYFIGFFKVWGKVTLLWSPGSITQLQFFFVSL